MILFKTSEEIVQYASPIKPDVKSRIETNVVGLKYPRQKPTKTCL